jgi:hypothetical protein
LGTLSRAGREFASRGAESDQRHGNCRGHEDDSREASNTHQCYPCVVRRRVFAVTADGDITKIVKITMTTKERHEEWFFFSVPFVPSWSS